MMTTPRPSGLRALIHLLRSDRAWSLVVRSILVLSALWAIGQWTRDATHATAFLFYIPSPLLAAILTLGAVLALRRRLPSTAAGLALLALVPALVVACVENRRPDTPSRTEAATPLRLVHWNVFGGHLGWDAINARLRQTDPDLVVLSEVPGHLDVHREARQLGPGWTGMRFGNMVVLGRGSLREGISLRKEGGVRAHRLWWDSPQGSCRLLAVDLASDLRQARDPRLRSVTAMMTESQPDIVVGDFNAPRRSRALSELPTGFRHAYEAAGSGLSYSWPVPCPMLAIDQCMISGRIRPQAYHLESTILSDHRIQVLEFTLAGGRR